LSTVTTICCVWTQCFCSLRSPIHYSYPHSTPSHSFLSISAAFQGSLDTECLTDEEFSSACKDYSTKLGDLEKLLAENGPKMEMMKSLAQEMSAIKLVVAESKPASDSPQVRAALANAKEVSAKFGAASPEAAVAWEELEEIASSGLSNAMGSRLDQECLVESAMEACQALEELDRVINLQKSNGEYSF